MFPVLLPRFKKKISSPHIRKGRLHRGMVLQSELLKNGKKWRDVMKVRALEAE